ncbi:hypothetical protein ABZX85_17450 [Streptomyces sp. NPDC004539]|uniref:hypothetical protein n=1 Tax=Streptomyces sp. NPDC004539 TaxID=3154280 RepID=UPI0033B458F3
MRSRIISAQRLPSQAPPGVPEPFRCHAVFVPGDPARTGRIAFWHPDGTTPPAVGSAGSLRVVRRAGAGVEAAQVPAALVPVREALPLLTRARVAPDACPSAAFWGAATLLALHYAKVPRLSQ